MKTTRLFLLPLLISIVLGTGGCLPGQFEENAKRRDAVNLFFSGNRPIRRMMPGTGSSMSMGGYFFFGIGTFSGSSETGMTVTFAWQSVSDSNRFIISTLPLEKVQVLFADTIAAPTATFTLVNLKESSPLMLERCYEAIAGLNNEGPGDVLRSYLAHATLVVRREDWPTKVQMPL